MVTQHGKLTIIQLKKEKSHRQYIKECVSTTLYL